MPSVRMVVFDFDGTLCDSANVKTQAFHDLYLHAHDAETAQWVLAYHLDHAGISRYDKIRHFETEILGRPATDEEVNAVADSFAALVERQVIEAPLFDGVTEFLDAAAGRIPLAVASATPTDELRRITDAKEITRYFAAVEGSPRSKTEILTAFSAEFDVPSSQMLMVGDQPSDLDGARGAGTQALMVSDGTQEFDAPTVDSFRAAGAEILSGLASQRLT